MKSTLYKQNCLIDLVKRVPLDRVFLSTPTSSYTYSDVVELSDNLRSNYSQLANKNCAIISDDRESLALLLPAIDSICGSVFLLPKDAEGHEEIFYQSADIHYVINLSAGKVSDVKVVSDQQPTQNEQVKTYILATSGTTGTPKLASYSLATLLATAKNDIKRGEEFTWGLTYDVNRFAGLQVYLQTLAAGSALAVPPSTANMNEIITLFVRSSVNCLSATPSFWRKMLMEPEHRKLPLKRITLGGEISNQSVLSALEQCYPSAMIIHIYASTEAGVGFVVKDKKEGFPSSYLHDDSTLACQLKIIDGNLWIKSNNGCSKFVRGNLDINDEGFINTGDMVCLENKRVLFQGRESGSINVGGNKVMPEKVESVLEQHSHVVMAKVFSKANPVLGALVACEVIIGDSAKELPPKDVKREVLSFCKKSLQSFEIPALFKIVETITTNATGKKVRS
ncbi:AMP-dependent synthetase [Vibrio sp. 10N.286.55.E10]|uniref:AMP-binding protein n=1 Tax=unclassified Vibrio TaxID=2614977 RepID=UPI000C831FFB|nr:MULTISPECIES: AMP-binding protein [unclassified Vibrio]PME35480.1 AMP-dependent synthetase [Vibrio sp. 10N.286.55.E10]PME43885.1 AMP-dependent synthetase [Vibrio sp. 10N.286.55.E12]PME66969.1 AMP-dependent synthetase [Vibrio sp. 10N.286.55.C11]PMI23411.1 AMP-dependent synthetase [Vibrio sp. 10N.286.46.E10]PMI94400.1 AMP-dependent synthetase [Vibrio sp. 10N.286.45.E10]